MRKNAFKIRHYRPGDFEKYVQLRIDINEYDRQGHFVSRQRLAEDLGHPSFQPEHDMFVAEKAGGMIGYASVFLEKVLKRALLDCMIHPLHRKKGIATELVRDVIRHAGEADSRSVQVCIPENNLPAKNFISRLGFRYIRPFLELQLDLNNKRLPNVEPGQYMMRSLAPDEADKLTAIQNRAFADSWGFNPNTPAEIAYRINLSSCAPENIVVAYYNNKPIGYCWTRILVEDNPVASGMKGEIHMLGVEPDFRGKGVGRNVLLAGLSHLNGKGVTMVELTADGDDPVALGLYKSVGFKINSRTEWYEKKLI